MQLERDDRVAGAASPTHPGAIRQIDHLLVVTHDPLGLFELFWRRFGLPPALPAGVDPERMLSEAQTTSGWWTGAGVSLGNIHLWFIRFEEGFEHLWEDSRWNPFETQSRRRSRVEGIALEPLDMAHALAFLDEQGIDHGPPVTHRYEHAVETTVDLPGFVDDTVIVSLSSYVYPGEQTRAAVHKQGIEALERASGGTLSLHSAAEVVIGAIDPVEEIDRWKRLLSPLEPNGNVWHFPNGCALKIEGAKSSGVIGLKLRCSNVDTVRNNLQSSGLLVDSESRAEARIDPCELAGLDIRLVPLELHAFDATQSRVLRERKQP